MSTPKGPSGRILRPSPKSNGTAPVSEVAATQGGRGAGRCGEPSEPSHLSSMHPMALAAVPVDPGDDYLVTGNKGLLGWQNDAMIVTTPRRFIEDLTRVEAQAKRPS